MQLTKTQAEEIVKRAVQTIADVKTGTLLGENVADDLFRDFSMLGLSIKYQLERDLGYQSGIKVLAEENVRLNMTITSLALQIGEISEHLESLSGQLAKHEEAWAMLDEQEEKAKAEDQDDPYAAAIARSQSST